MILLTRQPKIDTCPYPYDNKEYKYSLQFVKESNNEGYYIYDFSKTPYVNPNDPNLMVNFSLAELDSKRLRIVVDKTDLDRIVAEPGKYWEYLYQESKGSTTNVVICRIKNSKFEYCYVRRNLIFPFENFYKVSEDPEWEKKYRFPQDGTLDTWYGPVYKMNVWIENDVDEETREKQFEELVRKYIEENK